MYGTSCGRSELDGSPCACSRSSVERPGARVVHGQTVALPCTWYWLDDVQNNSRTFERGTLVPLVLSFELQGSKRKPKELGTCRLVCN